VSKLHTCVGCKKKKQVFEFYVSKNGRISSYCKSCQKEINSKYYKENSDKVKEKRSEYYESNKEIEQQKMKIYYEENKEMFMEYSSKRRADKRSACPVWLSEQHRSSIRSLYKMARNISKKTGIQHHVDHIIPLKSDIVCGLHVPWNLRIITASENLSKSNKLIVEDMVCS
jgi:flagellum-specific peptidoglycan hydrolase FlgJ